MNRFNLYISVILMLALSSCGDYAWRVVMDVEGFPLLVELDRGDIYHFRINDQGKTKKLGIQLIDYTLSTENNYWFNPEIGQNNYYMARVHLRVNGYDTVLYARAYQMPVDIEGLSIGVEAIREWEEDGNLEVARIKDLYKEVRLAISPQGEPHAPVSMRYPIEAYTWHASSYFNTWNSLVPYNHRYYHKGEDMAAIPDHLEVLAMFNGKIVTSPLPDGDGASNGFMVETPYGVLYRYAHINTESFTPSMVEGQVLFAGDPVGRTGETWNGGKNQYSGPHLHVEFRYKETTFNAFPAMMEAYFRDYPDKVIAIAGGYRFIKQRDRVMLDGTRSLARPGTKIKSYTWITHTGDTIRKAIHEMSMDQPGLYSEQLLVTSQDGVQDRDFLQVRVYDPQRGKEIVNRHVMYTPVRNIMPGDTVLFWNRINHNHSNVLINFGDGSESEIIDKEIQHVYQASGNYVVGYSTTGPDHEPGLIQVEVKVGNK